MTQDETNLIAPCKTCALPIKQGGHWNEILCFHALKNRVKELEHEVQREHQARLESLDKLVWDNGSKINHLAGCVRFQFRYLRDQIEWAGSLDRVRESAKTLARTGRELLKEVGL